MTYITIEQKMSNTGSIYDIASDNYDRIIKMGNTFKFAVVLPSYYGDVSSRHKTVFTAIAKVKQLSRDGYQGATILDRAGNVMLIKPGVNGDELELA
jgi:hypothetical protein